MMSMAVKKTEAGACPSGNGGGGRLAQDTPASGSALPDEAAIFLAKVSHELRTPLTAIAGFAELLKAERSGPLGSRKYSDYAEHILASAAHALSLLDDLLDPAQIQAGQFSQRFVPVDLGPLVEDVLATMRPLAAREGVRLEGDYALPAARVFADIRALRQILFNLLSNAIKHSPPDNVVTVRLAGTGEGQQAGLCLSVCDNGAGFDDALLEALGQPLDPAARDFSLATGHGLGLRLARSLAESNGARLVIEGSTPPAEEKETTEHCHGGTRVSLCFPPERVMR